MLLIRRAGLTTRLFYLPFAKYMLAGLYLKANRE